MTNEPSADISFEQLTTETVARYLASRSALRALINPDELVEIREVGDGNLNLVFIVTDESGASLVLKQSLPHVRTDPSWPMTRDRSIREAGVLAEHQAADAEHVPALYDFDAEHFVLAIENLSDHRVWRNELNEGRVHPEAAAEIGRYVARTAFATSVFRLGAIEHKRLVARSINPELCEITEDLVFTEPYIEHEHNVVLAANEPDVAAIRSDAALRHEIGLAKYRFETSAQSLLHGDLHTGSVFVRSADAERGSVASVRAFDSEFGFVGPTGFDLGALWGNFILAAARATALGDSARAEQILELPAELWSTFEAEYRRLWPERTDSRVWDDRILDALLADIRDDATVFAGAKAIRRIVGFAKASDIESLEPSLREGAARGVLRAGRALILERAVFDSVSAASAETLHILRSAATATTAPGL